MDHFEINKLSKIFYINPDKHNLIGSRESNTLEFKENFNFANLGEYAKVMASFANKEGGYIVFGIKDEPREIIGINPTSFDNIDQAKLSQGLNSVFQPAIEWDIKTYKWMNLHFGIIYTFPANRKPIIAIKNFSDEIKDGEIYFRYRGRSEKIKFAELHILLENEVEKRNAAWRRVFEKASSIDPTNVALMDTLTGEISGQGGTLVIDESLIPKLKFIREGDFSEKKGSPTLKLIGDLQPFPVTAIKKQKVLIGDDIYKYRPSHVAKLVKEGLKGKSFNVSLHIKAWKMYGCRPAEKKHGFKNEYAEFKIAENEYRYTQAWVEFLTKKLNDDEEYKKLVEFQS